MSEQRDYFGKEKEKIFFPRSGREGILGCKVMKLIFNLLPNAIYQIVTTYAEPKRL
jgi:hypothetical protein